LFHFLFETTWVDLEVALDFAVVPCNRQIVVSSNSRVGYVVSLSLSRSLYLPSFNFFPSSVLYNKNSRERTKRTVVQ